MLQIIITIITIVIIVIIITIIIRLIKNIYLNSTFDWNQRQGPEGPTDSGSC